MSSDPSIATLGMVDPNVSDEAVAFARRSFRDTKIDAAKDPETQVLYASVLRGIISNVKTKPGGFVATSGIVLPYYLNLSTNFMDPNVAPLIVKLNVHYLLRLHRELCGPSSVERLAIVGMEIAGGMLVAQLAAANVPELNQRFDYVYMRKERKKTGTAQQLEAVKAYTERTPESHAVRAIWVDDCSSTGSSLCDGIRTLAEDYSIDVAVALYLVDRSKDRKDLDRAKMKLSHDRFMSGRTQIRAIMDLDEVDSQITLV